MPAPLFYRLRIYRRADRPGNWQRRRDEHELVHFIRRAILTDWFEVENLAYQQSDIGDHHLMERLEGVGQFVGPDLAAPGVAGDSGDLGAPYPVSGVERQSRGVAGRKRAPSMRAAMAEESSAHYHDI